MKKASIEKQDPAGLSRRERQIMDAVYAAGPSTAAQVRAALPEAPGYSAVRAMLRILEEKGHLTHTEEAGKYVFAPTRPRGSAAKSALRRVLKTFFDNSASGVIPLLQNWLDAAPAKGAAAPTTQPADLNADQKWIIQWTDSQFRSYFDARKFAGWSDAEKANLEARCIDALSGPQDEGYYKAINTLGALRTTKGLPALRAIAFDRHDKNNRDRWMAIRVLAILGDKPSVPQLIHLVYHGNTNSHWWAQISLVKLTGQNFGSDWKAWGKWWNGTSGQPAFDPTVIKWWDGQPDEAKLAKVLKEQDAKFFTNLRGEGQQKSPATQATTRAAVDVLPDKTRVDLLWTTN